MILTKDLSVTGPAFQSQFGLVSPVEWCFQEAKRMNNYRNMLRVRGLQTQPRVKVVQTPNLIWIEEVAQ